MYRSAVLWLLIYDIVYAKSLPIRNKQKQASQKNPPTLFIQKQQTNQLMCIQLKKETQTHHNTFLDQIKSDLEMIYFPNGSWTMMLYVSTNLSIQLSSLLASHPVVILHKDVYFLFFPSPSHHTWSSSSISLLFYGFVNININNYRFWLTISIL